MGENNNSKEARIIILEKNVDKLDTWADETRLFFGEIKANIKSINDNLGEIKADVTIIKDNQTNNKVEIAKLKTRWKLFSVVVSLIVVAGIVVGIIL